MYATLVARNQTVRSFWSALSESDFLLESISTFSSGNSMASHSMASNNNKQYCYNMNEYSIGTYLAVFRYIWKADKIEIQFEPKAKIQSELKSYEHCSTELLPTHPVTGFQWPTATYRMLGNDYSPTVTVPLYQQVIAMAVAGAFSKNLSTEFIDWNSVEWYPVDSTPNHTLRLVG